MDKNIRAYVAGFIDGEGALTIKRGKDINMIQGWRFYVNIRVTSTNKESILYLKELFGGTVNEHKSKNNVGNWKPAWYWTLGSKKAIQCVKKIYPYLRIKKPQAEILFDFDKTIQHTSTKKITNELWGKRRLLKERINALNKRGLK